jgi:hypothetical protein
MKRRWSNSRRTRARKRGTKDFGCGFGAIKYVLYLGQSNKFDNKLPYVAAGTQPVDSENVPVEGSVETPHLLDSEQVCECFVELDRFQSFKLSSL